MAAGQTVWELTGAEGRKTITMLGGKMTATTSLDAQGNIQNLATVKPGIPNIRDFGYSFNALTGNLTFRINGLTGLKETFHYDALDRLTSIGEGTPEVEKMAIGYKENGNITSKTGLGAYVYDVKRPHAVALVDYNVNLIPSTVQSISYNAFNKADCLKDTIGSIAYQLDIQYGPDQQRWKSVLKKNGSDVKTIIFADNYEKFIDNGVTRELYYISAPEGLAAIYLKPQSGQANMYYVHTDHLGSIVSLTDSAGVAVFKASYDAWGKQTVSLNTFGFYRGYTGHEHLPEYGLINMNGRMYDPVLGRFLSPDNYVQAADFSQSFNRYSYCWNNPLIYTDPSGDIIFTTLAAIFCPPLLPLGIAMDVGGTINTVSNWDAVKNGFNDNTWKGLGKMFGFYGVGGGQVAATYYLGPIGTIGSSYGGDALNSLITDGTLNNFDFESTTMSLGTELVVGQIGIGDKAGDVASKLFKNEMSKKLVSNLVSQNVDGIISDIGISSWKNQSLEDGIKIGLSNYSRNWWKYSLSGLSQGYMEAKDKRTQQKEAYAEKAKEYYKNNNTMTGFEFRPSNWVDAIYDIQLVISPALYFSPPSRKNNRLYSPARNY